MSRIAKLIYAVKQDPDQYREKHGRCPRGYRFRDGKCQPMGGPKESDEPDEPKPESKPQGEDPGDKPKGKDAKQRPKSKPGSKGAETRKKRTAREKAERELEELFEKDMSQYLKRADELREQGVLPSREAAEKLAEIDDWRKLPEKVIRNPEALQKIVNQQAAQRAHEQRMVERKAQYLEDFVFKQELAKERGEKPPKLSLTKMARDLEEQMGRPVGDKFAASADKLLRTYRSGKAGSDPGSFIQRLREIMEGLVLPKWRHRIQSTTTATLSDPREPNWTLGFPPYAKPQPRVFLPNTRNRGFPPFFDDEGAVRPEHKLVERLDLEVDRAPVMRGFPPYDKPTGPLDPQSVGLPPYNQKPPRTKSYIPGKQPRPGFPPYQDGVYRVEVEP